MAKKSKSYGKVIEVMWGSQDLPPLRSIIRIARKYPHLKAYQTNDESIPGGDKIMYFGESLAAVKAYIKKTYPNLYTQTRLCAMTDELY